MRFRQQLRDILSNFEVEKALKLSDNIHEAESNGYKITSQENRLWEALTYAIEIQRHATSTE